MTYEQLLERLISDGIAEVREAYADPKDHHKRDGAIDGFEACRGKSPSDLVALYQSAERQAHEAYREEVTDYWRGRYFVLQVEFVLNVVSVGSVQQGGLPLLGWLPTARGAMKYAEIVGVREQGAGT
jgi:hypothetical protein